MLRRRQPRRRLRRRQDLLQHARQPDHRARRRDRQGAVAHRLGDINIGETMTMAPLVVKGKVLVGNSGGEMGVRGWLTALDAQTGKQRLARVQHRARQGRADRRRRSSRSMPRIAARTSASRPGRPTRGRSAAARCGAGSRTTRSSISSTTAPPIPARGIRSSVRATTSGPRDSSRATPTPAKRSGPIS